LENQLFVLWEAKIFLKRAIFYAFLFFTSTNFYKFPESSLAPLLKKH